MPRKKIINVKKEEAYRRIRQAGLREEISETKPVNLKSSDEILKFLKILQKKKIKEMICIIMYDIEDNKIRREVAKYLLKKGCQRIQKSVFLGKMDYPMFRELHQTLKDLQEVYENDDSILLVPISENELQKMKMIGRNISFELTLGQRNTLFF
ncbi:CRISPR-associated endonuclease Cas2 [Catalinimonas sp. 4WD22]|uniref:CRISPR-associated endonuclease Cas2 n=1 Tax=Catalinimonas locisalis TaxID=3133978 RepID=UPI003100D9B3